jgi:DNA gyrase subunit B
VIVMSVDAREHVFVRDERGVRMTRIGDFVDTALARGATKDGHVERRAGDDLGEVLCFGRDDHQVRFQPIRAVIRHPLEEKLYEIKTAYGRSVRVTASHSVFVHEAGPGAGCVKLKFGAELKRGDRVVAPRRMRLPETAPGRIDLLRELHSAPNAARQLWIRGPAIEAWHRARISAEYAHDAELSEARVEVPAEVGAETAALRRRSGVTNAALCDAVGIRQPITFYGWEEGALRPTTTRWRAYLEAIGADVDSVMARVRVGDSRLERAWSSHYSGSGANRVRPWVRLSALTAEDLAWFGEREDLTIAAEHHGEQGLRRFVDVTPELMTLLGFYLAEGSCSARGGIRVAIGRGNERFAPELSAAFETVFGRAPW